ncbi:MAG: hypothetical protein ACREHG_06770 [Candidatus Saccharimonadales bacterium]
MNRDMQQNTASEGHQPIMILESIETQSHELEAVAAAEKKRIKALESSLERQMGILEEIVREMALMRQARETSSANKERVPVVEATTAAAPVGTLFHHSTPPAK